MRKVIKNFKEVNFTCKTIIDVAEAVAEVVVSVEIAAFGYS